jgi:hypothetical protein
LLGTDTQPFFGSHAPFAQAWSRKVQSFCVCWMHLPAWHAAVCVHGSPSSQLLPSLPAVTVQDFVASLQMPM